MMNLGDIITVLTMQFIVYKIENNNVTVLNCFGETEYWDEEYMHHIINDIVHYPFASEGWSEQLTKFDVFFSDYYNATLREIILGKSAINALKSGNRFSPVDKAALFAISLDSINAQLDKALDQ